ncbi:MAG: tRNA-modifying protein YgfZ [Alphaproteobacteria bacterium]|nr:tRNA-modifying protein YgfZ [Alphaproteobacteria bacterium]
MPPSERASWQSRRRSAGRLRAGRRRRLPCAPGRPCPARGPHDFQPGDAFPHDADMDDLHGVAFDKGCFVGQEVVSRMQHRGTARRRIVRVEADAPSRARQSRYRRRQGGRNAWHHGWRERACAGAPRPGAWCAGRGEPVLPARSPSRAQLPDWARFTWPETAGDDA